MSERLTITVPLDYRQPLRIERVDGTVEEAEHLPYLTILDALRDALDVRLDRLNRSQTNGRSAAASSGIPTAERVA